MRHSPILSAPAGPAVYRYDIHQFSSAPAGPAVCRYDVPQFSSAPAGPAVCRCDVPNSLGPSLGADVLVSIAPTNKTHIICITSSQYLGNGRYNICQPPGGENLGK